MKKKRKPLLLFAVIWTVFIVAIGSSALTAMLMGRTGIASSHFVSNDEYAIISRYSRLDEVRRTLMEEYYEPLEESRLLEGAIDGMMAAVDDPYTFYYTTEEMDRTNENASGLYHGVGMIVTLTEDGLIEILRVYEGSPAERAGIRAGDVLCAIDGEELGALDEQTYQEAISRVGGEDGSTVVLTVQRDGERLELTATRALVTVKYVEWYIMEDDIGYVRISQFTGSAGRDFREALERLKEKNVRGVVIDLRDDPGGNLDVVVDIADAVLPEGIITTIEDRHGKVSEERSRKEYWDIPLTVLVNENSASGSELFSAAIQDYGRGIVVGETTYGKGIVQTVITFPEDGAGMQYTTAVYYSPKGRSIHGTGVEPDVKVPLAEGASISQFEPDPENDNQLAVALEQLDALIDEAQQESKAA